MQRKKVLFITTGDMDELWGNGGIKGSQKNYGLVSEYFGKENTYLCSFLLGKDPVSSENCFYFKRVKGSLGQLIAAMFNCKVYMPWVEKKIIKLINKLNVDLLFIDSSQLGRLARLKGDYKTIVFYHNIEADYAWNKVKNEGLYFLPSYWASKYNDRCGVMANKVMCLNVRDSDRLYQAYGRKADVLIPVTFADVFDANRTQKHYRQEIMFVGSFFGPNKLSVEWFIHEVMPKLDDIVLNIVGKGFEAMKEKYERNRNIHVIGSVNEMDEYYYRHAAVVLPIKYGAGMKVKTAEAMMYGRKIFASDEALEGYEVGGVKGIVRCNTADEYSTAINSFFKRKEYAPYMEDVRNLFLNKYETGCVYDNFCHTVSQLMKE